MIESRSSRYRAYMLRFWQVRDHLSEGPAVWRFSLEDPLTGERRCFADVHNLAAFLQSATSAVGKHSPGSAESGPSAGERGSEATERMR
jgi:hypothetical protein